MCSTAEPAWTPSKASSLFSKAEFGLAFLKSHLECHRSECLSRQVPCLMTSARAVSQCRIRGFLVYRICNSPYHCSMKQAAAWTPSRISFLPTRPGHSVLDVSRSKSYMLMMQKFMLCAGKMFLQGFSYADVPLTGLRPPACSICALTYSNHHCL